MKLKMTALLALSALIFLPQPSYSINFDEILRSYLGVAKPGSTDISAGEQAIIKTNINNRQGQLESELQAGARSGQLSAQEETELRADLDRIAALEGSYLADGNYNRVEVQSMLEQLNAFTLKLQTYLGNATTNTSILTPAPTTGSSTPWYHRYLRQNNDGNLSNWSRFQADIDSKQAQIDADITSGISSGRLDWNDARNLRVELERIAQTERSFTADGRLSYTEGQDLVKQLDELNLKLTNNLSNRNRRWSGGHGRGHGRGRGGSSLDYRQSLLRQRIDAGMKSGQLTKSEGYRLLADEARIDELESKLRSNDGKISFDEQRRLFKQLDDLRKKVDKELIDKQVR